MQIKQWEDKNLSHFSYAVMSDSEKKIVLIDPARDPRPYIDYARKHEAAITGVIETHPHADFVSCHAELHQLTGAVIYTSKLVGANYPHQHFDEGDVIELGEIRLLAINTPGHSPDSVSIIMEHEGRQMAVFTGDTLFIGDCGRPDLREDVNDAATRREALARQMYHSLRNKIMVLNDDVLVYPAHGAGSLCGSALSDAHSSSIGAEKLNNWSLQEMSEDVFTKKLLADQPFVPAYFAYNVEINKLGAPAFLNSVQNVPMIEVITEFQLNEHLWVIDTRDAAAFKDGHFPHSINLQSEGKFEKWLGTLIMPHQPFYLAGSSGDALLKMIHRVAAIGYEKQIEKAIVFNDGSISMPRINVDEFVTHENDYTIIDVRNKSEVREHKIFNQSINIPLPELQKRVDEIPVEKPVVVHCSSGYRSAAASSYLQSQLPAGVVIYDLGEAIKQFD